MDWRKIIYRALIINGVFHIWWHSVDLGAMPTWVVITTGVLFGFVINFDERR